jgi:hypothetical protein
LRQHLFDVVGDFRFGEVAAATFNLIGVVPHGGG